MKITNVEVSSGAKPSGSVPETIYEVIRGRAAENPNANAIAAPGRVPLTYRGLQNQMEQTAAALASFGLKRGDRVAIVLPNGPEMAVSFLSIASAVTCAPLNPLYKAEEFDFYLSDLNARALIMASGADSPARAVAGERNVSIIELVSGGDSAGGFKLKAPIVAAKAYDFAGSDDTALVLHTSGTTSRPKIVPLSQKNICRSAESVASSLALTESDCCLNVMPLFHIHGLIGALLSSMTAGAGVVCTGGFDPEKFFEWLDVFRPTWYTAVPTIHQALLARAEAKKDVISRRPMRFIRSCSAAMPEKIMAEMEAAFRTQLIEAYGMTEASHQMTSNPLPPRDRKPRSVGVPAGSQVAIMDEVGNLLPAGETGEVVIRGENVTAGYESNPKANQTAFTNGWFRTGDQGMFDVDGYLFLTGRLKEIINRGGEKIAPREIDEVLLQHPAVSQAVTFAVPHPTLGEDVAAAVVLKPDARVKEIDIQQFTAKRLAEFKTPKQVLILDEIPKGPTGKLQRIGLADKLAGLLASRREADFISAESSIEKQVAEIWRTILKAEKVGMRDDFNALGGDSLSMTAMIHEVESRFKITVSIDSFLKSPTVATLVHQIQAGDSIGAAPADAATSAKPITDSALSGLRNRLFQILALYAPGYKTTRVWLHRMRGVSIADNVSIGLSAIIETAYPRLVSIGKNVTVGMRVLIIAHFRDSTSQSRMRERHTVRIEDDVYLGPGVIVLPNVTIGRGAVVSAGSVVVRSVPPKTLVQGNPAVPVAQCGVSLAGGVSYEEFLRHLKPLKNDGVREV